MEQRIKRLVHKMPKRFKWTIHHVFACPLSEVLHQLNFVDEAKNLYCWTQPDEEDEEN